MADQLQHYVPRFLLRRFGTGKKDYVHVFDKQRDNTFVRPASKVAVGKNLYDFEFKGIPLTIEGGLSRLESKAAKHIARIVETRSLDVDDPVSRAELAVFFAVQMVRTPAQRAMFRSLSAALEQHLRARGVGDGFFKVPDELQTVENADRAFIAKSIESAPAVYAPVLLEKDWLLMGTDRKHPFLIGDHPFTLHNMIERTGRGNLGISVPGIEIYVPLTPDLTLAMWCPSHREKLMSWTQRLSGLSASKPLVAMEFASPWRDALDMMEAVTRGKLLTSSTEHVEFVNSLQISTAERFIFSSTGDFSLAKDMMRVNPELRHGRRMSVH